MADWSFIIGDAVVNRYVKALYEVSVENQQEDQFFEQIKSIREVVLGMKDSEKILKRFSLLKNEGRAFVEGLIMELDLSVEIANFLRVIAHNKRLCIIADVCDAYIDFVDKMHGKKIFYVTYAKEFSDENRIQLTNQLKQVFSGDIECVAKQDASLIDGIQIQYRSKILDYSMKSKLTRLERAIKGDSYEN